MTTLAQLNEATHTRTWGGFVLEFSYRVGSQSRQWTSSPKVHLLRAEKVIDKTADWKPGYYKVGSYFSVYASCNSNGQHTGTVMETLDTDAITCTKCLKKLGQLS